MAKVIPINMGLKLADLLAGPWKFTLEQKEDKPKLKLIKKGE